jgi:hypothetical protein
MGVPFDVNETCGKVTGGFATPGSAGRKAKPTRLKTAEFSTRAGRRFQSAVFVVDRELKTFERTTLMASKTRGYIFCILLTEASGDESKDLKEALRTLKFDGRRDE